MSDEIPHVKHPRQSHPGRHKPHHSDHSGAHSIGTREHEENASNPYHGHAGPSGMPAGMAEGSPAEEAAESPQEEAAEQSAGIGGAAGPGGQEGGPV
ncbi:MAG TPA: hypothetical protein VLH80_07615 [Nitrospiraceae bacterium]|nr:hypothetical protein [Nitrospiraceae bacterium]